MELSIEQAAERARKRERAREWERARRARNFANRLWVDGRWVAPVPEDQHGQRNTYCYHGCRCELCTTATQRWLQTAAQQERRRVLQEERAARRVLVDGRLIAPVPTERHGLVNTYLYHLCRCLACVRAHSDWKRRYHERPELADRRAKITQTDMATRRRNFARRQYIDSRWVAPLPPERHGLRNTYVRHGCRCEACSAVAEQVKRANQAAQRENRAARAARRVMIDGRLVAPVPTEMHGKHTTYSNHACRCLACTQAHNARLRAYQAARRAASTSGPDERAGVRTP